MSETDVRSETEVDVVAQATQPLTYVRWRRISGPRTCWDDDFTVECCSFGDVCFDSTYTRRECCGKKRGWASWEADGNLITYGWIFLVNTLLRNLLSNAAIKLTSNNLVVIGAGLQMLIFALNVTMLICSSALAP